MRDDERAESDIRRRAAWLLAMLAVVAGLFVLLSVTLFHTSGGGGTDDGTDGQLAVPTDSPASSAASSGSSGRPPSNPSSSPAASTSTPAGAVARPSCPGKTTCAVQGDVSGVMSAINAYRAHHGKPAVPTTSSAAAQRCALTQGDTCPTSFVWVRVDDLSGASVVAGVTAFRSNDDLLDNSAKSFAVGWAYDPASSSLSCALIRND